MGSRVIRQLPQDLEKKKQKAASAKDTTEKQPKRRAEAAAFGYTNIIEAIQNVKGLAYRPRTAETREVYELMLSGPRYSTQRG